MNERNKSLWKQAIKWPLYSVAILPVFISGAYTLNSFKNIKISNLIAFTIAAILILIWENLTNDLFDSETGIDEFKFHSIVNLVRSKKIISTIAYTSLLIGLLVIAIISISTSINVMILVVSCCFLGYLYQGPPFRLGYQGLGEPLCWLAFGPLTYSAALIALNPSDIYTITIPWKDSFLLGSGSSLATTLILFCSHFHQIEEDKKHGKNSPLVRLGPKKGAKLIPWIVFIVYFFQLFIIINGFIPILCILFLISLPQSIKLITLLKSSYNKPEVIKNCKFIAVKFQTLNGIGLIAGLIIDYLINK
ncbi:1,4-dihydroxy-2-naphthoate (DHNA) octaprenyltransferase [Prochlorococcus marinus str. MIT 9515]|uniref:2-carboxy-1,4-naphthoquinone phytyltransferase n=1 Tax=Prochlorococcus marinus (strain MIT 9515) TaxID=167542 RepID=A2BUF3_PROM5|nr:2-carboxy-1,4-naphthoquinone phytyltransferase [Prochlorococcus marinus]ABM71414.1 1,4-dihydroxy-2-naphthoate (DHNA) octaprenyltransferase [Prochlorococcus marinus str. MIT 9515]